ncbi:MAG: carboxypeptidase-like regulatory domain-containing protein [Bacteroidota bacterium]
MKNVISLYLLVFHLTSCSSYFSRSYTEGNVCHHITNDPIENAQIFVKNENMYVYETKTNSNGYFNFRAKKHIKLGYHSRDLATKFYIRKDNIISDTLSSYGGNDAIMFDSIHLKPVKK